MRTSYILAGVVALGVGLAGWATLGQAGPEEKIPLPAAVDKSANKPMPKPRPADDLFDIPTPGPKPIFNDSVPGPKPLPAKKDPVRVLDVVDVPEIPIPKPLPSKLTPAKQPSRNEIKPTVFIPSETPDTPRVLPATAAGIIVRQEPAISLEWYGPGTLQVNAPAEYMLVARNTSAIQLQKVIIQVRVPAGIKLEGTDPKAESVDSILMWEHGTMAPRQEKSVRITLVAPTKGEIGCQAWVTFTGSAAMKAQVREAKLAIATKVPEKIAVGEVATIVFQVSNTGDHAAEGVKLAIALGAGLECEKGPRALVDLNTIGAGETREVKVPCVARAAGLQPCDATAEAASGLKAVANAAITVIQAKLDLQVVGPKLRYLDRKATYVLKVTNGGDAAATGVIATQQIPTGFKLISADAGGKYAATAGTITWDVGDIGPGKAKELKCELLATGTGDFPHKAIVTGDRGLRAENSVTTRVEGLSAISMEVIDSDDPVEVGAETTFDVRVANTGSKDETDVKLVCAIPAQMKFKAARGPAKFEVVGNEVVFGLLPKLPAQTEVTYKITLTATTKGDARFKATLTAGGLTEPVVKQESTRVYSD